MVPSRRAAACTAGGQLAMWIPAMLMASDVRPVADRLTDAPIILASFLAHPGCHLSLDRHTETGEPELHHLRGRDQDGLRCAA